MLDACLSPKLFCKLTKYIIYLLVKFRPFHVGKSVERVMSRQILRHEITVTAAWPAY